MRLHAFLKLVVTRGASDLHLTAGRVPRIRINGVLHTIRHRPLVDGDIQEFLDEAMNSSQAKVFEERLNVDFAYTGHGLGRFRVNAYRHSGGLGLAIRSVAATVPRMAETGLPPIVASSISRGGGLVLVTGPSGSGKSTSLAAMVDTINRVRRGHIITLEDPIEFVHKPVQCAITQREIGPHAPTFADGLRGALREDPDVVLVGELRDLETIQLAITAAETGVQVLATLHTSGAVRCVDRIINVFPHRRQDQVRAMLAGSLRLVVSQQLVRRADGRGRMLAAEVLVNNPAAASVIRSGNSHKLTNVIQSGSRAGMQSLDVVLRSLVERGIITATDASERALDRTQFERMVIREEAA